MMSISRNYACPPRHHHSVRQGTTLQGSVLRHPVLNKVTSLSDNKQVQASSDESDQFLIRVIVGPPSLLDIFN